MSLLSIGLLYGGATLFVMFLGMPIAFALGAVATLFMIIFMQRGSVDTIAQNVYEEMASITLLSIPLFILKGAAIGRSPAGRDLYGALHAWMHWIPGTLGILLPPSITMILYAVAAEQSLGRLFLAAIGPALLLVALFAGYAMWKFRREYRAALAQYKLTGAQSELLRVDTLTVYDKFALLPRVLPFVILLTGVMIALYGGYATPSETAGLGAVLALILIAVIYNVWTPGELAPILVSTLKEST